MLKIRKKAGKEAQISPRAFSRYEQIATLSPEQVLEDMRAFAEKNPYSLRTIVESDLVEGLRGEALRKKKEKPDSQIIPIAREQVENDMNEYAEKNPDAPKPYFDRETLAEMNAERERKWARQSIFSKIKLAVGIPLVAATAFWFATSFIGVRVLPREIVGPLIETEATVLLATKYKDDPQIEVLKIRREHRRELEKKDVDRKRVAELEALMAIEEQKVDMRLRERYKDVKLGEIRHLSLARFPKTSSLRDFYAENPDADGLTVSEFHSTANDHQKWALKYLLLEFARHAGKEL